MHSTSREIAEIDLATGINSGDQGEFVWFERTPFLKSLILHKKKKTYCFFINPAFDNIWAMENRKGP